jgi:hypothetical protein
MTAAAEAKTTDCYSETKEVVVDKSSIQRSPISTGDVAGKRLGDVVVMMTGGGKIAESHVRRIQISGEFRMCRELVKGGEA